MIYQTGLTVFGELVEELCCNKDPDCLRCMRLKLRAESVVIFVRIGDNWEVGSYQSDIPREAAEAEFYALLKEHVPQTLNHYPRGLRLLDNKEILQVFPKAIRFLGKSIISAPYKLGNYEGYRLAWRDQSDPFSAQELDIIQCQGLCPSGCGPKSHS